MRSQIAFETTLTRVGGTLYMRVPPAVMRITGIDRFSNLKFVLIDDGNLLIVSGGRDD